MRKGLSVALLMVAALSAASRSDAQIKYELYNEQGATAPCLGIGLGMLIAKKCESAFQKAGFVVEKELGSSGLSVGSAGAENGMVSAVVPGSAAAQAGFVVGDRVVEVDGHPAMPAPAEVVAQRSFGPRDRPLHVKIRRNGAEQELEFARVEKVPPPPPKGEGMLTSERPIINWRGQFAPCIGMGPTVEIAYAYCDRHFASFGFIRLNQFAAPGFIIDPARLDSAVVSVVDLDSPAAKAGLKAGDTILAIEGVPLTPDAGANVHMLLFGKAGQTHQVVIQRGGQEKRLSLTLGPRIRPGDEAKEKS